ncbi:MAG: DUF3368 domain-containing protein [Phycisphaerae bacterium]|nr:DUF3368 domain-containing protein [Phycisphaerae bacterium]
MPPAVEQELAVEVVGTPAVRLDLIPGLRIVPPTDRRQVNELMAKRLGRGESEAIVLATEIRPDAILVDDAQARAAAAALGVQTLGVLGLLLRAKRQGLVDRLLPLIDRLTSEIGFRVSPQLRLRVLEAAGEA